jgi:hypothetical protein
VRTVDELCRVSGVYVASRTFRGWCAAADVQGSALLDLARLLRAVRGAAASDGRIRARLDADDRTVRAIYDRGFPGLSPTDIPSDPHDFLMGQKFIQNKQVLTAILGLLEADDDRRASGE